MYHSFWNNLKPISTDVLNYWIYIKPPREIRIQGAERDSERISVAGISSICGNQSCSTHDTVVCNPESVPKSSLDAAPGFIARALVCRRRDIDLG